MVKVDNVDEHYAHARAEGADITMDLNDAFYGERRYEATDLEGHRWHFAEAFADVKATAARSPTTRRAGAGRSTENARVRRERGYRARLRPWRRASASCARRAERCRRVGGGGTVHDDRRPLSPVGVPIHDAVIAEFGRARPTDDLDDVADAAEVRGTRPRSAGSG